MDYTEYIYSELYILIPILYIIGAFIKNSKIADRKIPLILGGLGVMLAGLWIFASNPITGAKDVMLMLFAAITQGVLCAAASVYTNNIFKQLKEKKENENQNKDGNGSVG